MYIPKNKILPNLYTNGDEFQIKSLSQNYVGYYYRLYNGKLFTGRNPNDGENAELIPSTSNIVEPTTPSEMPTQIALFGGDADPTINKEEWNVRDIELYTLLKGESIDEIRRGGLPSPYYPQPTESDYKLGEFQRYFCVKTNEIIYTEVTKEQYEKFTKKDLSVSWQYYTAFTLPWSITGNKEEVYKVNRNIVLITEQNIKRRGLQEFLKENYLKFCKETSTTTQTTPTPPSLTRGTSSY